MKKNILFIDNAEYRLTRYYKSKNYILKKGYKPIFFSFDKNNFLDLVMILINHKNLFVCSIHVNIYVSLAFRIAKIIKKNHYYFHWQHGLVDKNFFSRIKQRICFYIYPQIDHLAYSLESYPSLLRKFGITYKRETKIRLIDFSDEKFLDSIFCQRKKKFLKKDKIKFLYISQFSFRNHLPKASGYNKRYLDTKCHFEIIKDNLIKYCNQNNINLYILKHPGDYTKTLDNFIVNNPSFSFIDYKNAFDSDIILTEDSFLVTCFLELGVPVYLLDVGVKFQSPMLIYNVTSTNLKVLSSKYNFEQIASFFSDDINKINLKRKDILDNFKFIFNNPSMLEELFTSVDNWYNSL